VQVTIVRNDNAVYLDGRRFAVDCSALPANVHAVQWDGAHGTVEYVNAGVINPDDFRTNDLIVDFTPYQALLAVAQTAAAALDSPPPPTLAAAIADKQAQVQNQFLIRAAMPISYAVGGTTYQWDADGEAIQNIMGVVLLITSGVSVPDPRPWTPHGSLTPVSISHADLVGLGAAIAARKDALFVAKKSKQAAIAAITDVAAVQAYDPTADWPS
jgi:Domain of unknown function (DUF4376)